MIDPTHLERAIDELDQAPLRRAVEEAGAPPAPRRLPCLTDADYGVVDPTDPIDEAF